MKRIIVLALFASGVFALSFNRGVALEHDPYLEKIRIQYVKNAKSFSDELTQFEKTVAELKGIKGEEKKLKQSFFLLRQRLKRMEVICAYFDYFSYNVLNSPNLPKIEYHYKEGFVKLPPSGLQLFEEIVFAEKPFNEKAVLLDEIDKIKHTVAQMVQYSSALSLNELYLYEAIKCEVNRIYGLGLGGFDCPVSLNAMPEAKDAFEGIKEVMVLKLQHVEPALQSKVSSVIAKLQACIHILSKQKSFNELNRAKFFRECINPLYKSIVDLQVAEGKGFVDNLYYYYSAYDNKKTSLFDKDFLKPLFFNPVRNDTLNPKAVNLGRILFFDPALSINNKRACASCHKPDKAFTDGLQKSTALEFLGDVGRNAPSLINCAFQNNFQLDGRAFFLEEQFRMVMFSPIEMGNNEKAITDKMNLSKEYKKLFMDAFNMKEEYIITMPYIQKALGQYLRSLTALNSPFDKYMRGETDTLNAAAINGYKIFTGKAKCGFCHFPPLFNGTLPPDFKNTESEVLGITEKFDTLNPKLDEDLGRFKQQGVEEHKHAFKTPSLRNLVYTAPYMHNGGFKTLEEVIHFYNVGGGLGLKLDIPNQTLPEDRLNLNAKEIKELVAFMQSLSDTSGTKARPASLPKFNDEELDKRKVGGEY